MNWKMNHKWRKKVALVENVVQDPKMALHVFGYSAEVEELS